ATKKSWTPTRILEFNRNRFREPTCSCSWRVRAALAVARHGHQVQREKSARHWLVTAFGNENARALTQYLFSTKRHDASPPKISASGRGRCRVADRFADRTRASLPDKAGAHHRWVCPRRRTRHQCALDRSVAVGAPRSAVRRRQPAGRRWQC